MNKHYVLTFLQTCTTVSLMVSSQDYITLNNVMFFSVCLQDRQSTADLPTDEQR